MHLQVVRDLEVEMDATKKQVELTLSTRQEAEVLADLEFKVGADDIFAVQHVC